MIAQAGLSLQMRAVHGGVVLLFALQFLNAVLKNDAAGRTFLKAAGPSPGMPADFMTLRHRDTEAAVPN